MIISYSINVANDIPENILDFSSKVKQILNDNNGILKLYNYKIQFKEINDVGNINIILSSNNDIIRICNFDKLSCADRSNGNVYINYDRWKNGSEVFFNGLKSKINKLEKYKYYLINHEVMHILGFNHPNKKLRFVNMNTPVMAQQTINLQGGFSYWLPTKKDLEFFNLKIF